MWTATKVLRLVACALLAGLLLGGGGCTWWANHSHAADLANLNDRLVERERATVQAALDRERAARTAADQAQARLAETLAANAALTQERNHAIAAATTGRPCLGTRALRVLDGAPGIRVADLPGTAGGAAAADATAAADPDAPPAVGGADEFSLVSTDADLASWALSAGALYEQCRARLGGLIDYLHTTAHPKDAAP